MHVSRGMKLVAVSTVVVLISLAIVAILATPEPQTADA